MRFSKNPIWVIEFDLEFFDTICDMILVINSICSGWPVEPTIEKDPIRRQT